MQDDITFPQLLIDLIFKDDDNYYRRLSGLFDWGFLRKETAHYFGSEGQKSIDPVVFFKILLVGYLNNISSVR